MKRVKRLVLKVGSAVLTQDGDIATKRLVDFIQLVSELNKKYEIIIVSSGAVAAGYTVLNLDTSILGNKQALASLGQPKLIEIYTNELKKYNIIASQILLTDGDFDSRRRLGHAKDVITVLIKNKIIPIINENDVIAVEELVGDNDQLSGFVTYHFDADMLVVLTDVDGYYDKNPNKDSSAKLYKNISKINKESLLEMDSSTNSFATGGIVTKLKAANYLLSHKKVMFLTSGFDLTYARDYLLNNNHTKGTLFKND